MARKSTRALPSRADQRQQILAIPAIQKGERITAVVAGSSIGVSTEVASKLLASMVDDGLMVSHRPQDVRKGTRKAHRPELLYSKPPSQFARRRLRRHTDVQLKLVTPNGDPCFVTPNPFNRPCVPAVRINAYRNHSADLEATGEVISEAEVVNICREHFAAFGSLQAAGDHYGLTDGRLSQIQTGIHVSCPRVLKALGIQHRSGVYRRISA
jgi:hypothetical protein